RFMLTRVLARAGNLLGQGGTQGIGPLVTWLERVPNEAHDPPPIPGFDAGISDEGWVPRLVAVAAALDAHLQSIVGERNATNLFEGGYLDTFETFSGLETFPVVISLLPDRLLDEQKIVLLSRRQVQRVVFDQMEKLQQANDRLSAQNAELERVRAELQAAKAELEKRVVERTAALRDTTISLRSEAAERMRAEEALDRLREQQEALLHS